MRVLFVSSGTSRYGISPIVKNQGESLKRIGIDVDYFTIKQKGIKGYLKAAKELKRVLIKERYDVIHAHYWLSGIVATLAGAKPIVVSLMGDDVKASPIFRFIIRVFYKISWSKIIVKSKDMYETLNIKDAYIVSNGVNFDRFKPIDKEIALSYTKWNPNKRHILFTSDPDRRVKNFKLAKEAFEYLNDSSLELHYMRHIDNSLVPYYYNSADVVILTSLWEGSPNAIKEAMACNIPIVSVDVGDVRDIISNTKGCFIASNRVDDFANKIKLALTFNKRTTGREDIKDLREDEVAKKIVSIYEDSIKDR